MSDSVSDLLERISAVEREGLAAIASAMSASELTDADNKYLSKKGSLSEILKLLRDVPPSEKPKVGAHANQTKTRLETALLAKREVFEGEEIARRLQAERVDIALPARKIPVGSIHLISRVIGEMTSIFRRLGFEVAEGPEIESEFYNFDALNMGADHPARDMQDTFYLPASVKSGLVLRTHTSNTQVRTMLAKKKPPVRLIMPGTVFRSDYDMTHSPMFHQVEGLYVDQNVSFAELKGALLFFAREMFDAEAQVRMRPSYFPFVEPGAEVDISCFACKGGKRTPPGGCRPCKGTGWIEILGAGMVHRKVLAAAGFDAEEVSGFAFGIGVERVAMLKYDVPDLRLFFENDIRFLRQFAGA